MAADVSPGKRPDHRELSVPIEGMTCASCVRRVEGAVARVPGVHRVSANLASERATISLDPKVATLDKVVLDVPDISCEHCQRAIEGALGKERGVASVRVDVPTKKVFLECDPATLSLDQVDAILDDEGYAVAGRAPQ